MEISSLGGVFSLLLTPFSSDKSIDWGAYERYVDWQLAFGPDGLFAVCGSSEMKWLDGEERLELARRAVRRAGNIPVVATANLDTDPSRHREELLSMAETGLSAVVLVPPDRLGEDQQRLGDYFAKLVDDAPCPALIYEWPAVTPHLVDAEIYGLLVSEHSLAGIKDTTCTLEGIAAKIDRTGGAAVFQANAPFMLDALRKGAAGIMAIVTTAAADLAVALLRAAGKNEPDAESIHEHLVSLDCALGRGGSYPASAKYLASLRGVEMTTVCREAAQAAPEQRKSIEVWYAHARRASVIHPPL